MCSYVEYQCIYLHHQNPGIYCYNASNNRQQECGSLRFHLLLSGQAVEPAFKLPLICNAIWYSCRVPVLTVNFVCCWPGNAAEKQTVRLVLPLAMALMWRHCNGNAVYNSSHEIRNYLFNMIMLPNREC